MSPLDDFTKMSNNTEIADGLEKLRQAVVQASESGHLDAPTAAAAQSSLRQAIREAHMPAPSKPTLLDHLDSVQENLADKTAVAALAESLTQAADAVERLYQ